MIGQIIGNYKIEKKLGEGGMGAVYKGVDMMLEREVAVKALRPELGSQPQIVERFRSEAVTLAKLNHPNVATLYSFFRQGDDFFMVLEFVRGETLDSIISRHGRMAVEQAIPLFCQMLDGIDHAHRYGIIHRDIKPGNMMLTDEGTLKVLDFGIARILGTARMTRAGHLIGTIEYMSPEQVRGMETDARSDIYSLGMLLYEMLTGRVPFQIDNEFELMKAQIELMPPTPRSLNPDIPPAVEHAILRAITKNPDARFQTAGEFRKHLLSAGVQSAGVGDLAAPGAASFVTPRLSNPPVSDGAASLPTVTTPPSHSGSTLPGAGPASHPSAPGLPKETRLGAAGQYQAAPTGANQFKETRLGSPGEAPPPPAYPPYQTVPPPEVPGSFFSRLSAVHYVVGGVAMLFVLGLLVAAPLLLFLSGSAKSEEPAATPSVKQAVEPKPAPKEEVVAQPAQKSEAADSGATAVPTTPPAATDASNLPVGGISIVPQEPEKKPSKPATTRPSQPQTQPQKPKGDTAAAERARKRQEALQALDQ